jgi:transcription initiation factor TFIIB
MKCIAKVANMTKLGERTKRQAATEIMCNIAKKEISAGKEPMGLAASILYLSSIKTGEIITQSDIARAAGITEVTVRNRAKEVRDKLELSQQG